MNTLNSQQFKYSLSGESVTKFRASTMKELTPQQRLERLEKKFDAVVYFALALLVALFLTFFSK